MILQGIQIRKTFLNNRVMIGPMCQYSANNGMPSKWHYKHLSSLTKLGASLLMIESTAVTRSGRITKKDLQLNSQSHAKAFFRLLKRIKTNNTKIGIQISHSGRKGSSEIPWIESNKSISKSKGGWLTCAPSPIKRSTNWPVPKKLNLREIKKLKKDFVKSAKLALKANFDCLEIGNLLKNEII